jgi:multidrug efflux pump
VGHAELGAKSEDISVIADDKPAVVVAITPGPTANPVDVSNEINKILPIVQQNMPKAIHSAVLWDSSKFIRESIKEVKKTIFESAFCVIAVIFLFLGSWRVLLIPVVTIPLSLIGVCSVMLAMGYSLNTITFLAMVLAIGMVVDDAIVMSENIHRHITMGKTAYDAALNGEREIQFAGIAMTLTLAAVYAPIGFLTGLIGSLFKEFAFTLASAVILSGFIALTLSPMMCSKVMTEKTLHSSFAQMVHGFSDKTMARYTLLLAKVLQWRKVVLGLVCVILGASYFLYKMIPSELAPRENTDAIIVSVKAPTAANLAYTEKYTEQLPPIFATIPENKII